MATNSKIQITELDFSDIKSNFIDFLKSQDTFKDYNFAGSGMSVLLDILAYNTQYNAYYLNMVANEMFLDSALQRESVVSHAKILNYTPRSAISPTANVSIEVSNVSDSALTLPQYTNFSSEAIDGVNYNFVTLDNLTVNVVANTATFTGVTLKQGYPVTYSFTVNSTTNPTYTFQIPDSSIDTSTLRVSVQESGSNTATEIYTLATDFLSLKPTSKVFFLQEGIDGNYEIYFGDGILGNKLVDGNIVRVRYLTTKGTASAGANNFVLIDAVSGFEDVTITPITPATNGTEKETIDSIKFTAPKAYAAQGRAVTTDDYISIIQQNTLGYNFDAVNVWGGDQMTPQQFGKIFVSIKPTGGYSLTNTQKLEIIEKGIRPFGVLTVTPEIVDPDYIFMVLQAKVLYDSKKTNYSAGQLATMIKNNTVTFCNSTLNTFNSTFVIGDLIQSTKSLDNSFIGVDFEVYIQKRIAPVLGQLKNYTVEFGNPIERGTLDSSISFLPTFSHYDSQGTLVEDVSLEESVDMASEIGVIKSYYYDAAGVKNYLNQSAGTINYDTGTVTLDNFTPITINSEDGILKITAPSSNRVVSSGFNRIVTLDQYDNAAIGVTITTK